METKYGIGEVTLTIGFIIDYIVSKKIIIIIVQYIRSQ